MKTHSKKKLHLLAVKLYSLKEELRVSKQILLEAAAEVDKLFHEKYFSDKSKNDSQLLDTLVDKASPSSIKEEKTQQKKEIRKTEKKNTDPEVKKLFRKIALEIHPDRLIDEPAGLEKNKKKKMFQNSLDAVEDNDLIILVSIAIELGIEPPEVSREKLIETENKIITIKKEIKELESKYVWRWFFCSHPEEKNEILQNIFGLMQKQRS